MKNKLIRVHKKELIKYCILKTSIKQRWTDRYLIDTVLLVSSEVDFRAVSIKLDNPFFTLDKLKLVLKFSDKLEESPTSGSPYIGGGEVFTGANLRELVS